jgi:uncharacterized membrane protein YkvA (DUF1232 family)
MRLDDYDLKQIGGTMESFWDFAELALYIGAGVSAGVLILRALPNSPLREVFWAVVFAIAGLLGVYVVSPIDFLPDFIPLLGQLDDVLATLLAVVNGISGIILYLNRRSSPPELGNRGGNDLSPRR